MNSQCPYRHLSYASFRFHTYCRLFLSNNRVNRRSFIFGKARPNISQQSTSHTEPSDETINSSLHAQHSDSLAYDQTSTSNTDLHNDPAERSQPAEPATLPETSTEGPAPKTEKRRSEHLIESPVQIRRAKYAAMRAKKAPPPPPAQKALKHNPWAEILASPPRQCGVSGMRLPSDLLIDFGLVKHPDASSLWAMPTRLLEDELQGLGKQLAFSSVGSENGARASSKPLPSTRISNCPGILGMPELSKGGLLPRLFPRRLLSPNGPIGQKDQKEMVWRQDMQDFVLKSLRTYTTNWLKKSSVNDGRTVTPRAWKVLDTRQNPSVQQLEAALKDLGDLENINWGAVLVLDPKSEELGETAENSNATAGSDDEGSTPDIEAASDNQSSETSAHYLPDLIQLPSHASKVPIFDLRRLLSEANLDELRSFHPLFQRNALFFRPFKNITEKPLVALWKLKLHLSDDEDFPS